MDPARQAYWQKRLRPIRLGPEPIAFQLSQRRQATVVITILVLVVGLFMLAIFAAFGRVDIGLKLFGVEFVPATVLCWLDLLGLRNRASVYLREAGPSKRDLTPPG